MSGPFNHLGEDAGPGKIFIGIVIAIVVVGIGLVIVGIGLAK
jgi:hypothetical protein